MIHRSGRHRTALILRVGFALIVGLLATLPLVASEPPEAAPLRWAELPSIPDPIGFAGSFAGESGGALLVAGSSRSLWWLTAMPMDAWT